MIWVLRKLWILGCHGDTVPQANGLAGLFPLVIPSHVSLDGGDPQKNATLLLLRHHVDNDAWVSWQVNLNYCHCRDVTDRCGHAGVTG